MYNEKLSIYDVAEFFQIRRGAASDKVPAYRLTYKQPQPDREFPNPTFAISVLNS